MQDCLFSQTEGEVVEWIDDLNPFFMAKSYLCYWNIWSLSAVDFSRMNRSVTLPWQVMYFMSFFVQGCIKRNCIKGSTFFKSMLLPSQMIYCTKFIVKKKKKKCYDTAPVTAFSLSSNYRCVIFWIFICKSYSTHSWTLSERHWVVKKRGKVRLGGILYILIYV